MTKLCETKYWIKPVDKNKSIKVCLGKKADHSTENDPDSTVK